MALGLAGLRRGPPRRPRLGAGARAAPPGYVLGTSQGHLRYADHTGTASRRPCGGAYLSLEARVCILWEVGQAFPVLLQGQHLFPVQCDGHGEQPFGDHGGGLQKTSTFTAIRKLLPWHKETMTKHLFPLLTYARKGQNARRFLSPRSNQVVLNVKKAGCRSST